MGVWKGMREVPMELIEACPIKHKNATHYLRHSCSCHRYLNGIGVTEMMKRSGFTYRQIDYWVRTGLITPSLRPATGRGNDRIWGEHDLRLLLVFRRLVDGGHELSSLREHAVELRDALDGELTEESTLVLLGGSVHVARTFDEVRVVVATASSIYSLVPLAQFVALEEAS